MERLREQILLSNAVEALNRHESPFNQKFIERNNMSQQEVAWLCEEIAGCLESFVEPELLSK